MDKWYEANKGCICQLKVVTIVKPKKGRIHEVKYGIMVLLNPNYIDEVNCLAENKN